MIKQLLQYKWSNKVTYASSGSQGAVAQLDDTRKACTGTFVTLKGACGKTTTTTTIGGLKYNFRDGIFPKKVFHPRVSACEGTVKWLTKKSRVYLQLMIL